MNPRHVQEKVSRHQDIETQTTVQTCLAFVSVPKVKNRKNNQTNEVLQYCGETGTVKSAGEYRTTATVYKTA